MPSLEQPQPFCLAHKHHVELQISGFGGQGVVMAINVLGRVAAVEQGRNAMAVQSYGPESRGGASLAGLIIDDGEIAMPRVTRPNVVVVLSAAAYDKHGRNRPTEALLIAEQDLVSLDDELEQDRLVLQVPATRIAEELGRRIVANIVMLGFLCAATQVQPPELMKRVIAASVPSHTETLNLDAFDRGMLCGRDALADRLSVEEPP